MQPSRFQCRLALASAMLIAVLGFAPLHASLTDGRRYGQSSPVAAEDEIISLSLGVEVYGGAVEFCLERGMWAAHSERTRILTARQFEGLDTSRIVAGERTDARDNVLVSSWAVPSASWGIARKQPAHHRQQTDSASSIQGSEGLVVITCSMGDRFELSVYAEYKQVVLGPPLVLPPLHATNPETRLVLFRGVVGHEHQDGRGIVDQHMVEADAFLATDQPRRQAARARHAFEDLMATLWRSVGDGLHHHHHDDDAMGAGDTESVEAHGHMHVLESAVADGLRILIDTAGKHQPTAFWTQLEASLRRRIAFDDDHHDDVAEEDGEGAEQYRPADL